jgi:carbonic anhydrase
MYRYRLTRRFVLPEESPEPAEDRESEGGPCLLIACDDAVLDDTLLRSDALLGLRVVRTRANRIVGPGVDPALSALIERSVADGRLTDLVVCGHSGCRHFATAPSTYADAGARGSESWYERSLRRMADAQVAVERAKANVVEQMTILKRLPCVERGDLRIAGSFYLCESGTTLAFDDGTHEFRLATA